MPSREAAHVQLVEDRIVPRYARSTVPPLQSNESSTTNALGFTGSVVATVEEQIVERALPQVTVDRLAYVEPAPRAPVCKDPRNACSR